MEVDPYLATAERPELGEIFALDGEPCDFAGDRSGLESDFLRIRETLQRVPRKLEVPLQVPWRWRLVRGMREAKMLNVTLPGRQSHRLAIA